MSVGGSITALVEACCDTTDWQMAASNQSRIESDLNCRLHWPTKAAKTSAKRRMASDGVHYTINNFDSNSYSFFMSVGDRITSLVEACFHTSDWQMTVSNQCRIDCVQKQMQFKLSLELANQNI